MWRFLDPAARRFPESQLSGKGAPRGGGAVLADTTLAWTGCGRVWVWRYLLWDELSLWPSRSALGGIAILRQIFIGFSFLVQLKSPVIDGEREVGGRRGREGRKGNWVLTTHTSQSTHSNRLRRRSFPLKREGVPCYSGIDFCSLPLSPCSRSSYGAGSRLMDGMVSKVAEPVRECPRRTRVRPGPSSSSSCKYTGQGEDEG